MRQSVILALCTLTSLSVFAVPVEDLSHGSDGVWQGSMDATRPISEQVSRLRDQIEGLKRLDIAAQLTAMQEALSRLQGQVEEQGHQLAILQQKKAPAVKPKPALKPDAASPDASDLYVEGLQELKAKQYTKSSAAFERLIAAYPNDALVPEAHYWLSMASFSNGKYTLSKKAIQAFLDAPTHPKDKVPSAYYHLASIAVKMGDNASAQSALRTLIKDYPSSDKAKEAKKLLAQLGDA